MANCKRLTKHQRALCKLLACGLWETVYTLLGKNHATMKWFLERSDVGDYHPFYGHLSISPEYVAMWAVRLLAEDDNLEVKQCVRRT